MSDDDRQSGDDDESLFRQHVADAKPLRVETREPLHQPRRTPRARFRRQDEQEVLRECLDPHIDHSESSSGEYLTFNRGGIGKRTMRKLARGSFSIQDELDLHGMTVEQASEALTEFLSESTRRGYCCVRVVHGKGLGSGNRGPVLKRKVSFWLRRWSQTLAYVSARQVDGGTGALYVLLRRE